MKVAFAVFFYVSAIILIYAGFNVPGADGLNHHVAPRDTAELTAAMLVIMGCTAKLCDHACLFATCRRVNS